MVDLNEIEVWAVAAAVVSVVLGTVVIAGELLDKFLNSWRDSPFSNVIYPFKMSLDVFMYDCTKVKYNSSDEFKIVFE